VVAGSFWEGAQGDSGSDGEVLCCDRNLGGTHA
jgi:hypothetical protein